MRGESESVQDEVIRAVEGNPDAFIERYKDHPDSLGGRYRQAETQARRASAQPPDCWRDTANEDALLMACIAISCHLWHRGTDQEVIHAKHEHFAA